MIGIYKIESFITKRVYIGSAINIDKRWKQHRRELARGEHHSRHLQRHVDKHGFTDLRFTILELCEKKDLLVREQFYLDTIECVFNSCKIAGSCIGFKQSPETLIKKSKASSGINNPTYGLERTPEWRKKISDALKGKPGNNKGMKMGYSDEHRAMLRKTMLAKLSNPDFILKTAQGKYKPIIQFSKDGVQIREWEATAIASKKLNIAGSNIAACLNNFNRTAGGFKWKRKSELHK